MPGGMKVKKYIAIGTWKDDEHKNLTSVAHSNMNMEHFRSDLRGNAFTPWVVLSEKKFELLRNTGEMELYYEVKKLTSDYWRWNTICQYIEECWDIMEERMAKA